MVGIQDVFNILGDAMPFRGELGDVCDFTIFELPGVLAQGAISHVLAGVGISVVARAASSRLLMTRSHRGVEHKCSVNYVGFSQR
jgi:hypothetical protein